MEYISSEILEETIECTNENQITNAQSNDFTQQILKVFNKDRDKITTLTNDYLQTNATINIEEAEKICEKLLSPKSPLSNNNNSCYGSLLYLYKNNKITHIKYLQLHKLYKQQVVHIITNIIYEKNAQGKMQATKIKKKYFG